MSNVPVIKKIHTLINTNLHLLKGWECLLFFVGLDRISSVLRKINLKSSLLYVVCRQGKGQFNHAEVLMALTPISPSCCLFARQANVTCIQN